MANRAPRRDYLYVSTLGVERLTASLPESGRDRLTALEGARVGVGGRSLLAGATHATVMDVVAEVESTLRDEHRVRRVGDADLAVGEWFESPGLQMAYGVQAARRSADSDAAVFVGRIDEHWAEADSTVLLSGPARYLQDWRPAQAEDVSGGIVLYPSALFALLASLTQREAADLSGASDAGFTGDDRRVPAHRQAMPRGDEAREEQWLAVGYPLAQALASFGRHGLFPLSLLARAVRIVNFESHGLPGRWIVGTPLWVSLEPAWVAAYPGIAGSVGVDVGGMTHLDVGARDGTAGVGS